MEPADPGENWTHVFYMWPVLLREPLSLCSTKTKA
jgi:hypothetical protein